MSLNDGVSFGKIGIFRFWCQKVLPAVYDDSLSYYELLCKVVKYLNDIIELTNTQSDAITELQEILQEFMEGEFDSYIEEKVDEWFEEHQEDLMEEIEALSDSVESLNEQVNAMEPNSYCHPEHVGILRIATNNYNDALENNNIRWGQGMCVANGTIIQGISSPIANVPEARLYTRALNSTSWNSSFVEDNFYHIASIVYVPEIDRYLISTGYSGVVAVCTRENFSIERTITLGSSAIVLGYDKINNVLYGSNYGSNLFIIDPDDFSTTDIEIWNSGFPSGYRGTLQDIDCYNGIIYILYSESARIDRYRISDKKFIDSINFPNEMRTTFIGETEGMSITEDGTIYFSSVNHNNDMLAYDYTQIWKIDLNSPQTTQENWLVNTGRRTIVVSAPTEANLLGSQTPTGTTANPFPTFAEAFDFIMLNPYVNTIAFTGDHSDEILSIDIPQVTIEGQDSSAKTGRIQTTNAKTALRNFEVSPQVSNVTNFVQGYRCGMMMVDPSLTFADSPVPTSGHYLQTQGTLVTAFSNTNWPE